MGFDLPFVLPDGWEIKTVEQLIKDKIIEKPLDGNHGGIHPKSSDYVSKGIPFVMASDLHAGRVDLSGCKFITEKQANTLRKGFAKAGDVLISHKATIGRTAIVQQNDYPYVMLTPQVTYYRIIDDEKLSNVYLKAYFDSPFFQSLLALWAGAGSTRAYLGITGQLKLPVIVPPIDSQKFIANHVFTFNEKIELNTQTNQTLEQIAQAIFKSWFVDFEPVKAKMDGEQPEGMDDATASLFPEKLGSETGIPVGWNQGVIADIAKLNSKSWTKKNQPEQVHYVDLANTKNGVIETVTTYDFEEAPSRARRVLNSGDTIVGTVRPGNRSFAFIGETEQPLTGSTGFAVLSPKEEFWTSFVYLATTNDDSIDEYARLADGGAYPAIKPVVVADTPCVIPTTDIAQKFWQVTGAMLKKAHQNRLENEELAKLRDTLLPKLLSGEINLTSEVVA